MGNSLSDLMNQAQTLPDAVDSVAKDAGQSFIWKPADMIRVVVTSVEPLKSEIESLGAAVSDPISACRWEKGIALRLLALEAKRREQEDVMNPNSPEVVKHFNLIGLNEDPDRVSFAFSPFGLKFYEQITEEHVNKGWVKIYSKEGKQQKLEGMPPNFASMPPAERFGFWWKVISRKFKVHEGLQEGDTFWVYLSITDKTKELGPDGKPKYKDTFKNLFKSIKHPKEESYVDAPDGVEKIEVIPVRAALQAIANEAAKVQAAREAKGDVPF